MADAWPDNVLQHFLRVKPPATWPDGAWEKAVRVVASGRSYEQAAIASGVSKSAIIGAAHRKGFPARESPLLPRRAVPPKPKAETRNRVVAPKASKPLPPVRAEARAPAKPAIPVPLPRPVMRHVLAPRDGRGCRYPFGDPKAENFRFCADPAVLQGSSYCAEHHARCYTRTAHEVQRAAEVARQVAGTPLHRPYVTPRAA